MSIIPCTLQCYSPWTHGTGARPGAPGLGQVMSNSIQWSALGEPLGLRPSPWWEASRMTSLYYIHQTLQ